MLNNRAEILLATGARDGTPHLNWAGFGEKFAFKGRYRIRSRIRANKTEKYLQTCHCKPLAGFPKSALHPDINFLQRNGIRGSRYLPL